MTERRRASDQQQRPSEEPNPFAPPPEGQPDRPWQPRHPEFRGSDGPSESGQSDQPGQQDGQESPDNPENPESPENQRQRWGSQWSARQPRRQGGGFGEPPPGPGGERRGNGHRWDPADPRQRHARYAVLAGMWGVFAGLLGWEWLALLLGALALYWGISALRGGPKEDRDSQRRSRLVAELEGGEEPPPAPPAPGGPRNGGRNGANGRARPQLGVAVAGVVMASTALMIVAATYTVQLVYKDYFDCVEDALTIPSREQCEELLPAHLRPILSETD
jgi:hypothetical protein